MLALAVLAGSVVALVLALAVLAASSVALVLVEAPCRYTVQLHTDTHRYTLNLHTDTLHFHEKNE